MDWSFELTPARATGLHSIGADVSWPQLPANTETRKPLHWLQIWNEQRSKLWRFSALTILIYQMERSAIGMRFGFRFVRNGGALVMSAISSQTSPLAQRRLFRHMRCISGQELRVDI
jgi:hypothetical protein